MAAGFAVSRTPSSVNQPFFFRPHDSKQLCFWNTTVWSYFPIYKSQQSTCKVFAKTAPRYSAIMIKPPHAVLGTKQAPRTQQI